MAEAAGRRVAPPKCSVCGQEDPAHVCHECKKPCHGEVKRCSKHHGLYDYCTTCLEKLPDLEFSTDEEEEEEEELEQRAMPARPGAAVPPGRPARPV